MPADPQQLTLPEKIISAFRLPYFFGCLIVAAVAGGPGSFLVFYLGSFNFEDAFRKTVSVSVLSISPIAQHFPGYLGGIEIAESTLAIFVDLYLIKYLRRKVVGEKPALSQLSTDGEKSYTCAFAQLTNTAGPLGLAIAFFLAYFPARASIASSNVSLVGIIVLTAVANLVYGAAFWTYISALWGVYKFGLAPLSLKPFYEDRMLGLRPLGRLVLQFALIFSLAITLTLLGSLIAGDPGSIAINLAIVSLGVAMLFVPLRGIHGKMVKAKQKEEEALGLRFKELLRGADGNIGSGESPLSKIEGLFELQKLRLLREEVSKVSEWPFETRSVERLVAILLVIFSVLLTRLIQVV